MTHKPIRKAVFPAANLGTRFLPATKAIPKEMLPVVDRPADPICGRLGARGVD
jgi:UTP--glucose-1-phosphate uridylyltransferase